MRKVNTKMEEMIKRIQELKKEKDIVILAHYYVDGLVQQVADYVGDSYFLSEAAIGVKEKNIVFGGVSFMGESAKILNPEKHVYMADPFADCPMAHMVDIEKIRQVKKENPDVAVVCYVNSTAKIKAESDVCVTSSNAVRVVSNLPNQTIFFIPDNNLGRYVAKQVPSKQFIFHDGFCHVHTKILAKDLIVAKNLHPNACVLAHPECTIDLLDKADFIGSTSAIIDYATASPKEEFIICTELGVVYEMQQKNPNKKFYGVGTHQVCGNMKRVTLPKLLKTMETLDEEIILDTELMKKARIPLERMLDLAKKGV